MQANNLMKAKIQLLMSNPFFATVALGLKYDECSDIKTADVDGETMRYNPEFVNGLTVSKTKGLLAHEIIHVTNLHHTRRGVRDPEKWNEACDYAINLQLLSNGFELPDNGLVDKQYTNMSAEQIYAKLPDKPKKDKNDKGNGDPGGNGGVRDPQVKTKQEMQAKEAKTKQLISRAAMVAKMAGKLPAGLEEYIKELLAPVVNWKDVLNSFLTEIARNDYTWSQPSARYISQGIYLPSLRSVERGKFVLIVDTSASVNLPLLNSFAGEMQSVLSDVAEKLTVIHVDTKVQKVEEFENDDTVIFKPKGRGGTSFIPGFEHIEKEGIECACIVYFTDGDCSAFPVDPGTPTLWAVYNNKDFSPPFVDVIHVN
jgi:predicted metal-dependent peptidase